MLTAGAGVVTTRNHIHWFVTENGAVDLYGKTLQERARLLISVAHPSAQEELDRAAFERCGSHHHYIKEVHGQVITPFFLGGFPYRYGVPAVGPGPVFYCPQAEFDRFPFALAGKIF